MSVTLGKWVRSERERLGYSPRSLSDELGIDKSSLYGYERGDRSMPHVHLRKMVELGAEPATLLTGSSNTGPSVEDVDDIVDAVLSLTRMSHWPKLTQEEQREAAIAFVLRGAGSAPIRENDVA